MDFLNVATFGTSSSSTKVLVLDGNTVKSRTASQVVTDGGGGGSSSQRTDLAFSNPSLSQQSAIPASGSGTNPYPFNGADKYASRYKLNFVPTNYQISIIVYTEIDSTTVTSAVGLALEKSTDGTNWENVYNWDLRDIDGWTSTSGSVSFTGTPSNTFFRFNYYNAGYNDNVTFNHYNLVLSLWN
jgi:hypothetical protein